MKTVLVLILIAVLTFAILDLTEDNDASQPNTACRSAVELSVPLYDAQAKLVKLDNDFTYAVTKHLDGNGLVGAVTRHLNEVAKVRHNVAVALRNYDRYLKARERCLN